jgi:hypothetical protein
MKGSGSTGSAEGIVAVAGFGKLPLEPVKKLTR